MGFGEQKSEKLAKSGEAPPPRALIVPWPLPKLLPAAQTQISPETPRQITLKTTS